jgi:hypothetical protein
MRLKRSTIATLLAPTGRSGGAHKPHLPRCRRFNTLIHQRLEADPEVHRKYIGHDTPSQTGRITKASLWESPAIQSSNATL